MQNPYNICKAAYNSAPRLLKTFMESSERDKSTQVNYDLAKSRKVNVPIILEYLMVKKLPLSLEDGDMGKMSVLTDPTNEDLTCIKRKIRILDHPKNLIEYLHARLAISQGLKWEQRHNATQLETFYPNLPRWGSVTYF